MLTINAKRTKSGTVFFCAMGAGNGWTQAWEVQVDFGTGRARVLRSVQHESGKRVELETIECTAQQAMSTITQKAA